MNDWNWLSERGLLVGIAAAVFFILLKLNDLAHKLGPMMRHFEKLEDDEIERDIDSSA